MAVAAHYQAIVTNDLIGASNPALPGFAFGDPAFTDEQRTAAVIWFLRNTLPAAAGTRIVGVRRTPLGGGPAVEMPFPTAEMTALVATIGGVAYPDYGADWGVGGLTPLGTSITLLEYSATPGRSSTGRTYLPYVSAAAPDAAGRLPAINASILETSYRLVFLGVGPGDDLRPIVYSKKLNTQFTVTTPKASLILANLRSRRR